MSVPIYVYINIPNPSNQDSTSRSIKQPMFLNKQFFFNLPSQATEKPLKKSFQKEFLVSSEDKHKYDIINNILETLYNSDIYSQIVSINYVLLNLDNETFQSNIDDLYKLKLYCLIENETSFDTTPIMSKIYYQVATNSSCFFNILFIDLQPIFQTQTNTNTALANWVNYLNYFYITNANECIGSLSRTNVSGVDLRTTSSYPYYYSNWWWTDSNYFKTLPYSSQRCNPNITNGLNGGLFISLWTSLDWLNITQLEEAETYGDEYYKDKDSNITYVSLKDGYAIPTNLICFKPIIEGKPITQVISKRVFSLNTYQHSDEIPIQKYVKPEISACEYRDRLLRWNRPKKQVKTEEQLPFFNSKKRFSKSK